MNEPSVDTTASEEGAGAPLGERVMYVITPDGIASQSSHRTDLRALWNDLWSAKWRIAGISGLFALAFAAYALLATKWYRAEVLLAPAEARSVPAVLGGQLGGLAALAGVSIGGNDSAEAVAVLRSRELARSLIEGHELQKVFFAKDWDPARKAWRDQDPKNWPDSRDAVEFFHKYVLSVSVDRQTSLVTVTVDWTDPGIAADWADAIAQRANALLRDRALEEAERNVAYLKSELASSNIVTMQQTIGHLLESELQKVMLARGNEEFAFRVIDAAEPPKRQQWPKSALLILIGAMAGGIVGCLFALSARKRRRV